MAFVNIHGQPIELSSIGATAKAKRPPADMQHKGFAVTGISPAQICQARNDRGNSPDGKPFDEQAWVRNTKPQKVSPKPCATQAGAADLAELAERNGWKRVDIKALTKGVR